MVLKGNSRKSQIWRVSLSQRGAIMKKSTYRDQRWSGYVHQHTKFKATSQIHSQENARKHLETDGRMDFWVILTTLVHSHSWMCGMQSTLCGVPECPAVNQSIQYVWGVTWGVQTILVNLAIEKCDFVGWNPSCPSVCISTIWFRVMQLPVVHPLVHFRRCSSAIYKG